MTLLIAAAGCLVAEVLLLSAGYKALRPRDYLDAVTSYRPLRVLGPTARFALAWATAATEVASGALILMPATRIAGLTVACAVLLAFHVVVGGDDRPVIANCGCWGRTSFGVSRRVLLGRNVVLTGIAGAALVVTAVSIPASGNPVFALLIPAGMMLPLAFLVLEIPELVMLVRLRPGQHGVESLQRASPGGGQR